ncbi:MAG: hypothetical protein JO166_10315 [Deltaproteobacteria bacterium]|nr:hypothetical protein [Deltaproteobacteria bacterium]
MKRILFELSDRKTLTFRRSDMDYPDNRKKLLMAMKIFVFDVPPSFPQPTLSDLEEALACVPDSFGDYLAFGVQAREPEGERRRLQPTLTAAAREPGVNSGDNPVITDIDLMRLH